MKNLSAKIIAGTLILVFLALGLLGLLIPILPGILFLFIALILAARHFPSLERWLARNRHGAAGMRMTDSVLAMDLRDQVRLCFWGSLKFILSGVEWLHRIVGKQRRLG